MSRGSQYRDSTNTPAVVGGNMGVNQRTAQQAPVVANCYFKPLTEGTEAEFTKRCRSGLEDFGDGYPVFVATDASHTAPTKEEQELADMGAYTGGDDETGAAVFHSIDKLFLDLHAAGKNTGLADPDAVKYAVQEAYKRIRFFGFADTTMSLQNNHARYAQGSYRVTVRVGGDKTTINLGPYRQSPGHDTVWFMPYDPTLAEITKAAYPLLTIPREGEFQWRPVFMPLTKDLVEADIKAHGQALCLHRFIGRVLKPSEPNAPLTLNVSTRPSTCPPGIHLVKPPVGPPVGAAPGAAVGAAVGAAPGVPAHALFGDPTLVVPNRPMFETEAKTGAPLFTLVPAIAHAVVSETKGAFSRKMLHGVLTSDALWSIYHNYNPKTDVKDIQATVRFELGRINRTLATPLDNPMLTAINTKADKAVANAHPQNVSLYLNVEKGVYTAAGPGHGHAIPSSAMESLDGDNDELLYDDDV
jgi:hypothetical protein